MSRLHELMTEDQFKDTVIQLAMYRGWKVVHFLPAMNSKGRWRTAMQGDKGFPDLVLARRGVVLHVELKKQTGRVSREQIAWGEEIGESFRLWRPSDMDAIQRELR